MNWAIYRSNSHHQRNTSYVSKERPGFLNSEGRPVKPAQCLIVPGFLIIKPKLLPRGIRLPLPAAKNFTLNPSQSMTWVLRLPFHLLEGASSVFTFARSLQYIQVIGPSPQRCGLCPCGLPGPHLIRGGLRWGQRPCMSYTPTPNLQVGVSVKCLVRMSVPTEAWWQRVAQDKKPSNNLPPFYFCHEH